MSAVAAGRAALLAVAVIAVDQLTKVLARSLIDRGASHELLLGIDLVQVRNEGVAFGLLGGNAALVLIITLIAVSGLLLYLATRPPRGGQWIGVGLLAGGAVGNLIDRLAAGEVTDFIDPPAWPAFNFADVAITVGIAWLILIELRTSHVAGSP